MLNAIKKGNECMWLHSIKKFMQKSPDLGFGRGGLSARGAAWGVDRYLLDASTDGDVGTIISMEIDFISLIKDTISFTEFLWQNLREKTLKGGDFPSFSLFIDPKIVYFDFFTKHLASRVFRAIVYCLIHFLTHTNCIIFHCRF